MIFLTVAATFNLIMGITFTVIGIKKKGKKQFFKDYGIAYVFWVLLSTVGMYYYAIIN